jgi:hypothetical protein
MTDVISEIADKLVDHRDATALPLKDETPSLAAYSRFGVKPATSSQQKKPRKYNS